jgi:hypothetical protein
MNVLSEWPCGLRREMSSLAQTLGSWIRIPLKARIYICVYPVFVLSCVGSGLTTGWSPVQCVLPTVYRIHNSTLILMGNSPESLTRQDRRRCEDFKKLAKLPSFVCLILRLEHGVSDWGSVKAEEIMKLEIQKTQLLRDMNHVLSEYKTF